MNGCFLLPSSFSTPLWIWLKKKAPAFKNSLKSLKTSAFWLHSLWSWWINHIRVKSVYGHQMQNYRDFDAVIDRLFSPVLGFAIESPEVGIVPESDDLEVFLRGRQSLKNRITTGFFGSRGPGNGLAAVPGSGFRQASLRCIAQQVSMCLETLLWMSMVKLN